MDPLPSWLLNCKTSIGCVAKQTSEHCKTCTGLTPTRRPFHSGSIAGVRPQGLLDDFERLGGRAAIEAAAASLTKLRDERIDPERVDEPRRLVVLTATGFGYERTDGVAVVPITALGP